MSLTIGQTVGDYEVTGIIGAGGMGSVYKARNLISDRVDAMKVLLPDLRASADLADRFLNEIKVLASLAHPNIASLHTALRIDNQLIMIMEYVDGSTFDAVLQGGRLPLAQALNYTSQVLSALAYAHHRGVIHRDIKPGNIAISSQGVVKLLDFGLARGQTDRRMTRTGMVLGSLYYMSPEQVNGRPADARSDLYAVGVTLYRAITGRRPIDGESEFAVMRAQLTEMPLPPHQWDPSLPLELSDVIMRSLAKAPADRFQTAEEFRKALERHLPDSARAAQGVYPYAPEPTGTVIAAQKQPATPTGSSPVPSSTVFHSAALTTVQKYLAEWAGPIAAALVRKHGKTAQNLPELCRLLSEHIQSEPDRRAFLAACTRDLGAAAVEEAPAAAAQTEVSRRPVSDPNNGEPVKWDPAVLERCQRQLAVYIGPLAKIMVDRASKRARSLEELYALVGEGISPAKDREKFIASRVSVSR